MGRGLVKEKEISKIVEKFEKIMGPVARRIAEETAEKIGIKKGDKISPQNEEEYITFLDELSLEYSKIIGKDVVKTIMTLK